MKKFKLTESQYNRLKKTLLSENKYFLDKTTISDYDALINGDELPNKYNNYNAEIIYMSPEEYMRKVADIQGTTYEGQSRYVNSDKVKKYAKAMMSGDKFPIPYLNYIDRNQEGRHRVLASQMLTDKNIPVLVITQHGDNDSESFNKSYDLSDNKQYFEFIRLFDDDVVDALDLLLSRNYNYSDMKWETRKDYIYLPDVEWGQVPEQLKQLLQNQVNKLTPQQIKDAEDDDVRGIKGVEGMVNLIEYYKKELPDIFRYLRRLIMGVKKAMVDHINQDRIEVNDNNIKISIDGKIANVWAKDKDSLYDYNFDFVNEDEIYQLNAKLIDMWMNRFPFK